MAANDGLAHAQARHGKNQNQPLIGQDYRPIGEHYDKYNRMRCEQERSVFTMNCELLKKYKATKTLLDFKKIRVLGTGSFGRVLLVGEKKSILGMQNCCEKKNNRNQAGGTHQKRKRHFTGYGIKFRDRSN